MTVTHTSLGLEFARAFGARDRQRIRELVGPDVDFMALTPRRTWQATGPDTLLEILLGTWITDADEIHGIEKLEHDKFEDRERVGYRFRVANTKGEYVVEQQAYITEQDGRIGWMRVVCSGWRRLTPPG